VKVSVVGGSGYIGGELLRLLLGHPEVEVVQVTSSSRAGEPVWEAHPNLRHASRLRFTPHESLEAVDALFVALPHGASAGRIGELSERAGLLIDLSSDFRLRDPRDYGRYYGRDHPQPDLLDGFVAGIPELCRDALRSATRIAVPGCMANAAILALHPLAQADLLDGEVVVDARTGSSGAGTVPGAAGHHPERSGVMRVYRPFRHRHEPEISQVVGVPVRMSATAVGAVRGVQVVAHLTLNRAVEDAELRRLYGSVYGEEPFVRVVAQRRGVHRLPEPRVMTGSNFCDVGFARDGDGRHVVALGALDNLVKGGAGNAVQSFNIAAHFEERTALEFAGLHPV
jgi:[amino group carrier protein]-6-phospho-L-2-aminoadipate/5-phospho-L-glutamate reductase